MNNKKLGKTTFIKNQGQQSCELNLNKTPVRINFEAEPHIYLEFKTKNFTESLEGLQSKKNNFYTPRAIASS